MGYTRNKDRSTGRVTFVLDGQIPATEGIPALGYNPQANEWFPLIVDPTGALVTTNESGPGVGLTPVFDDASDNTTPGVEQVLISSSVPAGKTRFVSRIQVVCPFVGRFSAYFDGELIGSGLTGPTSEGVMEFDPPRPFVTGTPYEIRFTSRSGSPVVAVDCYLQASDMG